MRNAATGKGLIERCDKHSHFDPTWTVKLDFGWQAIDLLGADFVFLQNVVPRFTLISA